jgi:hypothetical protein
MADGIVARHLARDRRILSGELSFEAERNVMKEALEDEQKATRRPRRKKAGPRQRRAQE